MHTTDATQSSTNAAPVREYDAIVIGAGVSGLYQLYNARRCLACVGLDAWRQ